MKDKPSRASHWMTDKLCRAPHLDEGQAFKCVTLEDRQTLQGPHLIADMGEEQTLQGLTLKKTWGLTLDKDKPFMASPWGEGQPLQGFTIKQTWMKDNPYRALHWMKDKPFMVSPWGEGQPLQGLTIKHTWKKDKPCRVSPDWKCRIIFKLQKGLREFKFDPQPQLQRMQDDWRSSRQIMSFSRFIWFPPQYSTREHDWDSGDDSLYVTLVMLLMEHRI
ncbi:hypothetical protein MAR_016067 [Mya arenaria]|uniref:Uncharacterized protein n=1 Tax=Mya arenaria TaxID=6604 RepID=A0ABY7FIU0_MYAAR|nr:hypothetical protein MAR_016067 [Mya arenaria]